MVINKTLSSGVRVVIEPNPYVQSAAIGIWVRTGSIDENEKNRGISHFIEHMLFKGTEKRTARQIAEDSDWIGAQVNAFTSKEVTCYYMKVLASELENACEILTDMFLHSRFDPEEMEREKNVIYEEMKMSEDDPEDDVHDLAQERVFRGTPFECPVIGYKETLAPLQQSDLNAYFYEKYTADHIVVSAAGNVDADSFCAYFEKALQGLKPTREDPSFVPLTKKTECFVKVKEVEQSHLCLAIEGTAMKQDSHYAFSVFSNLFGGSMSSRLFQKIREEKGLAYSVYSTSQAYSSLGVFSIYAGVAHDKTEELLDAISEELDLLKCGTIGEREIHMAKLQLKSSYTFSQENVSSRMFAIGRSTLLLDEVLSPAEVLERVDRVTAQDVAEVALRLSDLKRYSGVLISRSDLDLERWLGACV